MTGSIPGPRDQAPGTAGQDAEHLQLVDQFPGWTLWVSGTGRWWASRQVELTAADLAAGCVPFLHADDPPPWPLRSAPRTRGAAATPGPDAPS